MHFPIKFTHISSYESPPWWHCPQSSAEFEKPSPLPAQQSPRAYRHNSSANIQASVSVYQSSFLHKWSLSSAASLTLVCDHLDCISSSFASILADFGLLHVCLILSYSLTCLVLYSTVLVLSHWRRGALSVVCLDASAWCEWKSRDRVGGPLWNLS